MRIATTGVRTGFAMTYETEDFASLDGDSSLTLRMTYE